MRILVDNSIMTLELEKGEMPERHLLQAAIQKATEDGIWSVFLVLRPEVANAEFDLLSDLCFRVAGIDSQDSKSYLRLKRHIRTSGETGGSTTVPTPQLAPSPLEAAACLEAQARYSTSLSEARLAELAAMGKQPDPEPTPDPVIAAMRKEIAELEAAQNADGIDSGTF